LRTLCLLVLPINASSVINIGLIYANTTIPKAPEFLKAGLYDVTGTQPFHNHRFRLLPITSMGCFKNKYKSNDAAIIAEMYYKNDLQMLFGPACDSGDSNLGLILALFLDLNIIGRLTKEWNILQFSFGNEHFDNDHSSVVQTSTISTLNAAFNLVAFFKIMSWDKVVLIWSVIAFDDEYTTKLKIANIRTVFKLNGISLLNDIHVNTSDTTRSLVDVLMEIKNTSRIWIPIFGYYLHDYIEFLAAVKQLSLDPTVYVTVLLDFVLVNNYYSSRNLSIIRRNIPADANDLTIILYTQLYESGWLYSTILRNTLQTSQNFSQFKGLESIIDTVKNSHFLGPFGTIWLNQYTVRLTPFQVKYVEVFQEEPVGIADLFLTQECGQDKTRKKGANGRCITLTGKITNYNTTITKHFPVDMPLCGFEGEMCDYTGKSGETSQMPWAIPYQLLKFVNIEASSMMSVQSLQQQMESKIKLKDLLRSREFAMTEFGAVIVEPYALKAGLFFDNSDVALLHQMKQLVHDNINQFVGICLDKRTEFYAIWNHCFRGTLADLMFFNATTSAKNKLSSDNEIGPAFQENFKRAFVRDIIRGLEFLHSSTIGYHGSLTPSQCLIDSRWILKLSGFGLSKLLYKWRIKGSISAKNGMWLISNSDLHYYSPEMRRFLKNMSKGSITFNAKQARAADIYAFGIILYEIVFHRKLIILDDNHYDIETVNEDTLSIFCESVEALIPPYPSIPGNIEVHPDLLGLMHKCWSGIIDQRPEATLARKITDATLKISGSLVDQMIKNLEQYTNNLEKLVKERTQQLEEAQEHAERLLLELLPKSVADELKVSRRVDPKNYKSATVMYSDVVGFTSLCSDSLPMEVVTLLSGVFQKFDIIISQHQCYKVETIGDAYMVTSGVPITSRHNHVRDIASVAIIMRDFLSEYEIPHRPGQKLHCRWGFNTGPVFAGVVGLNAPRYCVFGQTVTLAAKMENSGLPDKIQISLKSYQLLTARYPEFKCSPRGGVRIDGIGTLLTYWLDDCEELLASSRSVIGSDR
uniref:guanylate cyclase n=1 Tax=Brugia pahangi TaxID=6280 RepID=A0A0N4TPP8_BRUPA